MVIGLFNDFFEHFLFQDGMIAQCASLVTLENKNFMHRFEFIIDFL